MKHGAAKGERRNRRNLEWYNKSVPNYAAVFEGPKPFFFWVRISMVPDSLQEVRATIQATIEKL